MTRVRTRNTAKNYAKTDDEQSILTLDGYGKINIILIDNLDHFLNSLRLYKTKQLAIADILNANMVYALASQLNLRVGIYKEADTIITDYIKSHISDDIEEEDKAQVLEELKTSWQRLHQHPLAKRYVLCGKHQPEDMFYENPPFAGFGSYEIFIKDYLYSLARTARQKKGMLPAPLRQLIDLALRSLQGKNYFPNIFLELEQVDLCLRWRAEVEPFDGIREQRKELEEYVVGLKGLWFDRVKGTIMADLEDIENEFPDEAGSALAQVLDSVTCDTDKAMLKLYVQPLIEYLSSQDKVKAFASSVKFESNEGGDPYAIFREAIKCAIVTVAQNRGLVLKQHQDVPMYYWAGKGLDKEDLLLFPYLQQPSNMAALKPFELEAIANHSQHKAISVLVELEKRTREVTKLIGGITFLTLTQVQPRPILFRPQMMGTIPFMPTYAPKSAEEVLPEVIPEEENILQLSPKSTCALI